MKITKVGSVPKYNNTWWIGKQVECTTCYAEATLEEGDLARVGHGVLQGTVSVQADCPTPACSERHNALVGIYNAAEVGAYA